MCLDSDYFRYEDEFIDTCRKECPVACYSEKFATQVRALGDASNVTEISFRVPDLSVVRMSQKPRVDRITFLSNVGGLLFLFLGVSVLTLVEIVEILCQLAYVAVLD